MFLCCCQPPQPPAVGVGVGEAQEPPRGGDGQEAATASDAAGAAASLPDGVLAQAQGAQGQIRVEERDGLRLLTITDDQGVRIVHAARPIAQGMLSAADPIAALISLNRPSSPDAPPRVLVIGLGSGQTAADIAALGYAVDAVEREPVVIEMARAWFGYQGRAVAADGLDFLRKDRAAPYEVIVLDAFQGQALPPAFQTPEAVALLSKRLAPGGLLIARLLAAPEDAARSALISGEGDRFSLVLGSGVGAEPQNVLILSSDRPISALLPPSLALWPVRLPSDMRDSPEDPTAPLSAPLSASLSAAGTPYGLAASITLIAYLSQTPDGALALDLPHYHMGARRYLLRGPEPTLARLRGLLPADASFPTEGDISSDGDVTKTLIHVLGGGGVKRSEVRFSPVVVAARGNATLRAVIGPDHIGLQRGPFSERPAEARAIPYGGVLYDLDITDLLWTLDASRYEALRRAHIAPALKGALKALDADLPDLAAVQSALTDGLRAFADALGPNADQILAVQSLQRLIPSPPPAPAPAPAPAPKPSAFDVALACDLAQHLRWSPNAYDTPNPDARALGAALARCALQNYLAAAHLPYDAQDQRAPLAAARLLGMVESLDWGDQKPPASSRDVKKLLGRFSDPIEPLYAPPAPQ